MADTSPPNPVTTSTTVAAPAVLSNDQTFTVDPTGTLTSRGTPAAIYAAGTTTGVSVINQGTIIDTIDPVIEFNDGGSLSNQSGAVISGLDGFKGYTGPSMISNAGTILASGATGVGIDVSTGQITNAAAGQIAGFYGVELGGGTLANNGMITASDSPGSTGVVLSGGTLENVAGSVIYGDVGVQNPSTAGTGTVTIINAGTIESTSDAQAIRIQSATADLIIDPGADFIGTVTASSAGTIELASASSAGTIDFQPITGHEFFFGFPVINEAPGANWTITAADFSPTETISIGAGATLNFSAGVAAGDTIDLASAPSTLGLSNLPYSSTDQVTLASDNILKLTNAFGTLLASIQLDPSAHYTGDFTLGQSASGNEEIVLPCFVRGTRVRTQRGEIPVEALKLGDQVMVLGGGARPIRWLGRRRIDISRHPRPEQVRPVRVLAEAFGPGLPARDLVVSPGHSLYVAGALIPAELLLNGATIVREAVGEVEYFHVELDEHAVLFSENLPSESYLDTGNRSAFEGGAALALHPDFAPRHWRETCAPLVLEGPLVVAARGALLARARALGFRPAVDPDLHLRLGERRIEALRREGEWYCFLLPPWAREVAILSRAGIPAGRDPQDGDCRTLGVRLHALFLNERFVPLDAPSLARGFYPLEKSTVGAWRWSDGCGVLALRPSSAPLALRLRIAECMPGWQRAPESLKKNALAPGNRSETINASKGRSFSSSIDFQALSARSAPRTATRSKIRM